MTKDNSSLYWKALIASAGITFLVLACMCLGAYLIPRLGFALYKHSYFEARKQEIVDLVADHTPPETSIAISQARIAPPLPRSDGWFLDGWLQIYFTLTLETKEDLPDSFDLSENLSDETPNIQRVSCNTPERLRSENAGTLVYKLECTSWARCSPLSCLLLVDQDS
jgi:hypothetical protein